jgi:hypothetical protein
MFQIKPAFAPRFVSHTQLNELYHMWHLSLTALAGSKPTRHQRINWAAYAFAKENPGVNPTAAYKDLCDALEY